MQKYSLSFLTLLAGAVFALPSGIRPSLRVRDDNISHLSLREVGQCATPPSQPSDDTEDRGLGIQLTNSDSESRFFFVYENSCDTIPLKYVSIAAGQTKFVPLPPKFEGRIVRGTEAVNLDGESHLLGTWVEIHFEDTGVGWGDVSLIKGCDGAAEFSAMDGSGISTGFSDASVLNDAPASLLDTKESGSKAIKFAEDKYGTPITEVTSYLASKLGGYGKAYIDDAHVHPVIQSSNGHFSATFYSGRP